MYSVLILILIPLISSILAFVSSKKWAGIIAVGASLISLFYFLILISGFNAMHEIMIALNGYREQVLLSMWEWMHQAL